MKTMKYISLRVLAIAALGERDPLRVALFLCKR